MVVIARVLPLLWLLVFAPWSGAEEEQLFTEFLGLSPADLSFEAVPELPGASFARLLGDPEKPGLYVMRYRIPAGQLVPPHHHNEDRHITVISGSWAFGTGHSHRCEDTRPMPPGSYVFHPKGAVHFDGSCSSEPIEVQVIGVGPVNTVWWTDK